jgi:hypothetical protein
MTADLSMFLSFNKTQTNIIAFSCSPSYIFLNEKIISKFQGY